jgi:hypothetical protein
LVSLLFCNGQLLTITAVVIFACFPVKPYAPNLLVPVFGRCTFFQVHSPEDSILTNFFLMVSMASAFSARVLIPAAPVPAVPPVRIVGEKVKLFKSAVLFGARTLSGGHGLPQHLVFG